MSVFHILSEVPHALLDELDRRAKSLITHLHDESKEKSKETDARFCPSLFYGSIHIEGVEWPSTASKSVIDVENNEVARYFKLNREWVGLSGKPYGELIRICRTLRDVPQIAMTLSLTALVDASFNWLRINSEQKEQANPFTATVLNECLSQVEQFQICIPLEGISIDAPLQLGKVVVKALSQDDLLTWSSQWRSRWPAQNHPQSQRVTQFFSNMTRSLQNGSVVGATFITAESRRAVERALDEVQEALGILRFYSMSNFYPEGRSKCAILGTLHDPKIAHLLLQGNALIERGTTSGEWPDRKPEHFSEADLLKMKAAGFGQLTQMLALEVKQRTPFQGQLLKAILIYDRSTLTRNVRDTLLNVVVALESLFVRDSEGSLRKNVAYRMAFLLGESLDHRRHIIEIYFKAYEARSNIVHRGDEPGDVETIKIFLEYAWHTFKRLIQNSQGWISKEEMLEHLDDMKFSSSTQVKGH